MKMIKIMMIMLVMVVGVAMGDIVDETCKQTPDPTLCGSLLRSDPRSASADTVGLALVLVDKIKAVGTETIGQINEAYKTKPALKQALDECTKKYKTIVEVNTNTAMTAIKGNPKFGEGAIIDSSVSASSCERGFPQGQSPLTSLNEKMIKMCDVTKAIIKLLL